MIGKWTIATVVICLAGCALDPAALGDAVSTGAGVVGSRIPDVARGLESGTLSGIIAGVATAVGAAGAAYATYERRKRKRIENGA